MADAIAEDDQSRERSRSLASMSASRWRDKLKEKANKFSKGYGKSSAEQHDANVSDFLRPSSSSTTDLKPANLLGLTIPSTDKLDPGGYAPVPATTFRKKPKPKGLHVSFTTQEPEVIGEGGDESEIPAKDVKGSWKGPRPSPRSSSELQGGKPPALPPSLASPTSLAPLQNALAPSSAAGEGKEANFRQSFLQRAPTKRPVGGWEQRRQSMNMEEGLVQAHKQDSLDGHLLEKIDVPILDPKPIMTEPLLESPESTTRQTTSPVGVAPPALQENKSRQTSEPSYVAFNPSMPKAAPPVSRSPLNVPITAKAQTQVDSRPNRNGAEDSLIPPEPQARPPPRKEPSPQRSRSATTAITASQQEAFSQNLSVHEHDGVPAGQAESEDFYSRMQHLRGVFRLAAEKCVNIENKALEHWLRVSAWWFLRGKATLEKNSRASRLDKSKSDPGRSEPSSQQCYVDLAKAWWAMEEIIPDQVGPHSAASIQNMLDTFDGLDYPHLLGVFQMIQSNMNGFAIFMARNNLFPPPAVLIQGADPCIWIDYPTLPPGILALTAGLDPRTLAKRTKRPFFPIFFGDTDRFFSYGRVFGEVEVVSEDGEADDQQLPCIISIVREKTSSQAELTIASQDGQVNLHIQADPKIGPTWKDVEWKIKAHSIRVHLSRDFQLALRLWDEDFRILWGINDYIRRVEADWKPQEHEELLFDDVINVFHYAGPAQGSGNFPSAPVRNCPVRVFEQSTVKVEGSAQRKIFNGLRLVVVTPPNTKTLSSISRIFGKGGPTMYSNLRGEADAPALMFSFREGGEKTSLILTFKDTTQRANLHTLMAAVSTRPDETPSFDIPLERMWIEDSITPPTQPPKTYSLGSAVTWKSVKVIDRGPLDNSAPRTFSDRLRICSTCNLGTVVDLANLGTGELQISLNTKDISTIKLYRPPQHNMLVSYADNMFPKEEVPALQQTLQVTSSTPTTRVYKFSTLKALHEFERLVTGFDIVYDGLATMFSISHRRNVIAITKRMEASQARLQIIKQRDSRGSTTFQLIAVLEDFPQGRVTNFQLRGTDVFEAVQKSGKHCVRLVDAKFPLPKQQDNKEMAWDFVCLDTPEYAGEHDDIVIGFDDEEQRDNFARALPAPLTKVSRMQSFRK